MENKIKNLLFDLGGVIMNLTRSECVKAFKELGLSIADELLGEYAQKGPFMALEDGSITAEDFRAEIRKFLSRPATDEQIDWAFNRFLAGIPVERLRALAELRKRYRVYMLSNTNSIMFDSEIRRCFEIDGKTMTDYYDGIVTSYVARCAKPDAKIYRYAIEHLHIVPEETLFFDDGQVNLDAAEKFGFHTALVPPGVEFIDVLNARMKQLK